MPLNNVKLPAPKNAEALSGQEWGEWERTVFTDPVDPTISFLEGYSELTENLQVFILNEDNKLTSINANSFESETLASMAMAGRLFVRKEGENQLRQFAFVEREGAVLLGLSEPFSDLTSLPEPAAPQAPEAPAWWKYLLYPFFRSEFQAYDQAQEVYEQQHAQYVEEMSMYAAVTSPAALDKFDIACGKEPRSQAAMKENVQEIPQVGPDDMTRTEQTKTTEPKENVREETMGSFVLRLNMYTRESATVANVFFNSGTAPTEETILNEMLNIVRRTAAINILREANADNGARMDEVLQQAKESFDAMMHDMKSFLPTLINPKDMNALVGKSMSELSDAGVVGRLNDIAEGALGKYHEQLDKENAEKEQEQSKELQQDAAQLTEPQLVEPVKSMSQIPGMS